MWGEEGVSRHVLLPTDILTPLEDWPDNRTPAFLESPFLLHPLLQNTFPKRSGFLKSIIARCPRNKAGPPAIAHPGGGLDFHIEYSHWRRSRCFSSPAGPEARIRLDRVAASSCWHPRFPLSPVTVLSSLAKLVHPLLGVGELPAGPAPAWHRLAPREHNLRRCRLGVTQTIGVCVNLVLRLPCGRHILLPAPKPGKWLLWIQLVGLSRR